jgi:hypothetical protein
MADSHSTPFHHCAIRLNGFINVKLQIGLLFHTFIGITVAIFVNTIAVSLSILPFSLRMNDFQTIDAVKVYRVLIPIHQN